jgi:hypothetical protein
MRVAFYPFFSQQDKRTRKFRLDSDSGVKLYAYMARRMREIGWESWLVLPDIRQIEGELPEASHRRYYPGYLAIDNLDRRLQWEPGWLRTFAEFDLVLTQHEFLAYPLRCLCPNLKIVTECGMRPDQAWPETRALFDLAYNAADAIHFNSQTLADEFQHRRKWVWQFAYDEDIRPTRDLMRNIEVVFPARASATGYSGHEEFVKGLRGKGLTVIMTDPTGYLRQTGSCHLDWLPTGNLSRDSYLNVLARSRVVVSLTRNGYGGWAFREAIAAGAVPVCPRLPEYEELLGPKWPYYVEGCLYTAVQRALHHLWHHPDIDKTAVHAKLAASSYQSAWQTAKRDIECLMNSVTVPAAT